MPAHRRTRRPAGSRPGARNPANRPGNAGGRGNGRRGPTTAAADAASRRSPARAAHRRLDHRIDEDPVDPRIGRGEAQQRHLARAEPRGIDRVPAWPQHRGQGHGLARRRRRHRPLRQGEPDIDIESGLVAGMAEGQRAAARLGHVADIERRQPRRPRALTQPLDKADHVGVAEIAVAAEPDDVVARAVERQLRGTGDAAAREPCRSTSCARRTGCGHPAPRIAVLAADGRRREGEAGQDQQDLGQGRNTHRQGSQSEKTPTRCDHVVTETAAIR